MTTEEIADLYRAGATGPDLSRESGLSITQVYRLLDAAGVERRTSGRRRFEPAREAEIVRRYAGGANYQQLAEAFDCSTGIIARLIKKAGIDPRGKGGMQPGFWSEEQRRAISGRTRGSKSSQWKGGRTIDGSGYVLVKAVETDPIAWSMRARPNNYVREHRLVMARHRGRALRAHETVHHKNGDKADNRIENLELRVGGHGKGATHAHCATCTCFD